MNKNSYYQIFLKDTKIIDNKIYKKVFNVKNDAIISD